MLDVKLEVAPASREDRETLARLLELYLFEFSAIDERDIGEDGRFGYRYLDAYWQEPGRYPFLIRVDRKLAGFALVRSWVLESGQPGHTIAEFFVLPKYRRRRVGETAARWLFERFPGPWEVAEWELNSVAQAFWRAVIDRHTAGAYREHRTRWDGQPVVVQVFETAAASVGGNLHG